MRISLTVAPTLLLLLSWPFTAVAGPRPHILLLLSDDHSYPYLSAYGNPNVKTPTLDRLAPQRDREAS